MDIVWQAEDSLREKKVESDLGDLLKTMVAFANSVAPGDTAKIFIGERDDGTVQGVKNTDNIQKSVVKEAEKIYPEIYYRTEVYEREGKQCVRVDIKHNGLAPHFGGPAWVRRGSQTVKATEELYQQMISLRNDKVQVMAQWLNKGVTVSYPLAGDLISSPLKAHHRQAFIESSTLTYVGHHWITVSIPLSDGRRYERSEPIEYLLLSWDDVRKRLNIIVQNEAIF
jgi:hypothetical protein